MAGNSITVNTDQVAEIANNIERLNTQLRETLDQSRTEINNLANIWTGEAATATIDGFNSFANNYFQDYEEVIKQYVQFLRVNVDAGYFETETVNTNLAEAFK